VLRRYPDETSIRKDIVMPRRLGAVGGAFSGAIGLIALSALWGFPQFAVADPLEPALSEPAPSLSDPALAMSRIVLCDSVEEVNAFVGGDPAEEITAALDRVNGAFGTNSCNVVTTLYKRDEVANTLLVRDGVIHVVKIKVLGVMNGPEFVRLTIPATLYAPLFEKADAV
jgi:hypothetical protein